MGIMQSKELESLNKSLHKRLWELESIRNDLYRKFLYRSEYLTEWVNIVKRERQLARGIFNFRVTCDED
jgi:hypothetical protein